MGGDKSAVIVPAEERKVDVSGMSVGNDPDVGGLNVLLGDCAVSLRDATDVIEKLWGYIESLGPDEAGQVSALAALPSWKDPENDPQQFWAKANNLWAIYQLYHGQIAQPGAFNFHDSLAVVRGAS